MADGCETMLRDTKAPEILARENPTLLRKICDWLGDWVKKIKAAFSGVDARHEEAKALLRNAEQLQARFDKALAEAVQNREAVRAENETTAEDGGRVQYSIETLKDGRKYVKADRQVLTGSDPEVWGKQISDFINEQIRQGQDVAFPTLDGHILLLTGRSSYKLSDRHVAAIARKVEQFMTNEDFARKGRAAVHIDELIQVARFDGYRRDQNGKHKNDIGEDGFNYFESFMLDADGGYYRVPFSAGLNGQEETTYSIGTPEKRRFPAGRGSSSDKGGAQNGRKPSADIIRTADSESQVKSAIQIAFEKAQAEKQAREAKVQKSERDNSASDRELLREAAEHEGASEELKRYAKKADNLEAYQRRLDRQEAKLKSKELSGEEREALEKRVDETKALIARTQTALTQMELRPSMQQEIQEARENWWGANMGDAVQTAREIQKENRYLKEAVDYYHEQAKLTTPENRSVDPADLRII